MNNDSIKLPDGRNLSFIIFGPRDGSPVFYFHGTPSSRMEPTIVTTYGIDLNALLNKYNVRLISIDRPGNGFSSFNPAGNFNSFAHDVYYLKQQLKITTCKVLCWSGGGPFALAMAHAFPEEVAATYIVAGFTRSFSDKGMFRKMYANKFYFGSARYFPGIAQRVMNLVMKNEVKRTIPKMLTGLPHVDYNFLSNVENFKHVAEVTSKESCRVGSKGAVYEAGLYFKKFGFRLSDIQPPVHFWWGSQDKAVIREHPVAVEKEVKNRVMHYKQNEGHLSIYINYIEEVLSTIAAG